MSTNAMADLSVALDRAPKTVERPLKPIFLGNQAEQNELRAEKERLKKAIDQPLPQKEGQDPLPPVTTIPIIDHFKLAPQFVSKLEFKFDIGRDPKNIPAGVKRYQQTMTPQQRMEANLKKGAEVAGTEVTEQKRLATRKYDTALGILAESKVFNIQMLAMLDLNKVGFELRDVNVKQNSKGLNEVCFLFTREPFADNNHFQHCEEKLARKLLAQFAKDTNAFAGMFWNPNNSVRANVGQWVDRRPAKILVIRDVPATAIEGETKTVPALIVVNG